MVVYGPLGVAFAFCQYDCARAWCEGQELDDQEIAEKHVRTRWCISCAECGAVFHRPADYGFDWCDVHGAEDCPVQRWEFTRQAGTFVMAWRRLSNVNSLGARCHIPDWAWTEAFACSVWTPDASGAELARLVWAKRSADEGPFDVGT